MGRSHAFPDRSAFEVSSDHFGHSWFSGIFVLFFEKEKRNHPLVFIMCKSQILIVEFLLYCVKTAESHYIEPRLAIQAFNTNASKAEEGGCEFQASQCGLVVSKQTNKKPAVLGSGWVFPGSWYLFQRIERGSHRFTQESK